MCRVLIKTKTVRSVNIYLNIVSWSETFQLASNFVIIIINCHGCVFLGVLPHMVAKHL